jgi:hypothetical protein
LHSKNTFSTVPKRAASDIKVGFRVIIRESWGKFFMDISHKFRYIVK